MGSDFFHFTRAQRTAVIILSLLIVALLLFRLVEVRNKENVSPAPAIDSQQIRETELFLSTLKEEEENPVRKERKSIPPSDPFEQKVERIQNGK